MFFFKKKEEPRKIALFFDGPNMLRKEFNIDLDAVRKRVEKYGRIQIGKIFLNQFAPQKLVEAVTNQGFEPIIGMGGTKNDVTDVDVYLSVEAMDAVHNPNINTICLVSRDADFLPVVQKAKAAGKQIIIVGQNPGFSKGLQRAADIVIDLAGQDVVNTQMTQERPIQ